MASTSRRGSRRTSTRCSSNISAPTGTTATMIPRCGTGSSRFRTRNCGTSARDCDATSSPSSANARRFTGYKRPELIFTDPARLARILNATGRPVQIIFAGKSHPADDIGKHHLQRVYKRALDPMFAGRIAFVDDYDLHVAHFLVQGCDVWLNNPRKPLEASGTSG